MARAARSRAAPGAGHPRSRPASRPPLQRSRVAPGAGHPRSLPASRPPLQRSRVAPGAGHPRSLPASRPPLQWSRDIAGQSPPAEPVMVAVPRPVDQERLALDLVALDETPVATVLRVVAV